MGLYPCMMHWGGLDTNYLTRGRFSAGNIGILTLVKSQMWQAHLLRGRSRKLSAERRERRIMKTGKPENANTAIVPGRNSGETINNVNANMSSKGLFHQICTTPFCELECGKKGS